MNKKDNRNVLLTGGTGFLGSNLLKIFLLENISEVFLLVRGENKEDSNNRIKTLVKNVFQTNTVDQYLKRIHIIYGAFEGEKFAISDSDFDNLRNNVNYIYHCAAITGFDISYKAGRDVNYEGTRSILDFASLCKRLKKLNYISTTFIAGSKKGDFTEESLDEGQGFNNNYEKTKFEAENLVRSRFNNRFSISIFRPSVIIGDYNSGNTSNFKMFYEPLRIFSSGIFDTIPADTTITHNLVPVDVAARAIFILGNNELSNRTYHIISPQNTECGHFYDLAANYFGYKNPKFVPLDSFDLKSLTFVQKKMISAYIPYFNYEVNLKSLYSRKVLEKHNFSYPPINDEFYLRIFAYCRKIGFIRRRNNNVLRCNK